VCPVLPSVSVLPSSLNVGTRWKVCVPYVADELGESYAVCVFLSPNTMVFVFSVDTVSPLSAQKSCSASSMDCSCWSVSAIRVRSSA
jgi:hypothetical protein